MEFEDFFEMMDNSRRNDNMVPYSKQYQFHQSSFSKKHKKSLITPISPDLEPHDHQHPLHKGESTVDNHEPRVLDAERSQWTNQELSSIIHTVVLFMIYHWSSPSLSIAKNHFDYLPIYEQSLFAAYVQSVLLQVLVSSSTIFIALKYLWQLRFLAGSGATLGEGAERRLFVTALLLAAKMQEDYQMTLKTWAHVSGFELEELRTMEYELLSSLKFNLFISPESFDIWLSHLDVLFEMSRQNANASRLQSPTIHQVDPQEQMCMRPNNIPEIQSNHNDNPYAGELSLLPDNFGGLKHPLHQQKSGTDLGFEI